MVEISIQLLNAALPFTLFGVISLFVLIIFGIYQLNNYILKQTKDRFDMENKMCTKCKLIYQAFRLEKMK
jgi:hypothetical protein